jgi:hypothetical protein
VARRALRLAVWGTHVEDARLWAKAGLSEGSFRRPRLETFHPALSCKGAVRVSGGRAGGRVQWGRGEHTAEPDDTHLANHGPQ